MTDLWFVRHAPTHAKTFVGWRDVPADLSDTTALANLALALPEEALIISSDLIRCIATADAIQGPRERLPHDPDLREFNFGDWDGLPFAKVAEIAPEVSRAYWEKPGDIAPPNGESWNAAATRISAAVDRLIAAHSGRALIIVAHIGAILTQVQRATGKTAYDTLAQHIHNLSITHITAQTNQWTLNCVNMTAPDISIRDGA